MRGRQNPDNSANGLSEDKGRKGSILGYRFIGGGGGQAFISTLCPIFLDLINQSLSVSGTQTCSSLGKQMTVPSEGKDSVRFFIKGLLQIHTWGHRSGRDSENFLWCLAVKCRNQEV